MENIFSKHPTPIQQPAKIGQLYFDEQVMDD
jgi:hypothetical protein